MFLLDTFLKDKCMCLQGKLKVVTHSSYGTSAILKYFCPLLGIQGLLVRGSPQAESLCCAIGQDTFICCFELVQPRKTGNRPDMTEKLMTRTKNLDNQTNQGMQTSSQGVKWEWYLTSDWRVPGWSLTGDIILQS